MQPKAQQQTTTKVTLTDQQRKDLAAALGVDIAHVPHSLAVVGVPDADAKTMGMPQDQRGQFSPSVFIT